MATRRTLPLKTATQLGLMLRAARKAKQMTQREVASLIGLSQNRVSHLESHPDELSVRQLLAWSSALGLDISLGERGQAPLDSEKWEW